MAGSFARCIHHEIITDENDEIKSVIDDCFEKTVPDFVKDKYIDLKGAYLDCLILHKVMIFYHF